LQVSNIVFASRLISPRTSAFSHQTSSIGARHYPVPYGLSETAGLEDQLKSNMEKMLRDRATTLGVDEMRTGLLIRSFNTIYEMKIEPGLKSMLTDVNQYNDPDKSLESRTDDLNAVLYLGR
jgi:hypothetical protein